MARFAQYYLRYDLTDLFARERMDERQKIFGSYFENNDSIEFSHGEGEEKKVFKHQVYHLTLNRNIIVMRIANDKKKTVEQDFKEVDVKHEPSCFVLIDNRENCRRIAIQKNKAFGSTKTLAEIIASHVSDRMMCECHIGIELYPQFYPKDFYQAWRLQQHHTSRLRFNMCDNDLPSDFAVEEYDDESIMGYALKANEESLKKKYRTVIELNPPDNESCLYVDEDSNYIRNLVRFSASTGNSIEIVTHDGAKFVCFIDEEGESDKVVTNEFDTELLDLLFDEEAENREGTEQKVLEYVNGMKYTVDNEEKGEAVA